jgi:hypothetical protein
MSKARCGSRNWFQKESGCWSSDSYPIARERAPGERNWLGKGINHDSIPEVAADSLGKRWATTHEQLKGLSQLPIFLAKIPETGERYITLFLEFGLRQLTAHEGLSGLSFKRWPSKPASPPREASTAPMAVGTASLSGASFR